MSIVCVIEQTPGKLHLCTCPGRQGGSILGTRGSRGSISGSGEKGREGVCVIVLHRVAQLCIKGGRMLLSGAMSVAGVTIMPRGEASPSPLAACATTKRAETFRGVRIFACRLPTNQKPRQKSRGALRQWRPANSPPRGGLPTPLLP